MPLAEIAAELSISVKTVSTCSARILEKLGLKNPAQITCAALERGWVQ